MLLLIVNAPEIVDIPSSENLSFNLVFNVDHAVVAISISCDKNDSIGLLDVEGISGRKDCRVLGKTFWINCLNISKRGL